MTRLLIHVEGQTEERFVNEVLAPHLYGHGYTAVGARLLGNTRARSSRGGVPKWSSARRDILRHLKEDVGCLVTTMVDYYGLREWPGVADSKKLPFGDKATAVENALRSAIAAELGGEHESRRFLPFVVMHEFEALLFSDCQVFADSIGKPGLAPEFQAILDSFGNPEAINDSPTTAPSKRVEALFPRYKKVLRGVEATKAIGIETILAACPHFRDWVERLLSAVAAP